MAVRAFCSAKRGSNGSERIAKRSCARPSATPRVPSGQYFAASSTAFACSTDETMGTITPVGAGVERARDVMTRLRGYAHDERQICSLHVAHDLSDGVEAETGMFHVEHGEIGAGRLQDLADARRGELEQEGADLRGLAADECLQSIIYHCRFPP